MVGDPAEALAAVLAVDLVQDPIDPK
jgi:hypothetical protein